ncbi:glycoside hydrolase [candidate division KSB1 bacterium]|nr:glycoside hydrolase [candidate division KSB1 bacterium]
MKRILVLIMTMLALWGCQEPGTEKGEPWPAITKESKPWTYWWWMGSAVDKSNLTYNLTQLQTGGFGGVHIIPIYGVKGEEENFIPYLSSEWMDMLDYTLDEATRLGLGVDMTIGTGWPFGGPQVTAEMASERVHTFVTTLQGPSELTLNVIDSVRSTLNRRHSDEQLWQIAAIRAYADHEKQVDLFSLIENDHSLVWKPEPGSWTLVALVTETPVQQVKRAAPGAEGNVLDPFSVDHLQSYLDRFDQAFASSDGGTVRSFYHDSYEYYGAEWTDDFLEQFKQRRGYDLNDHLLEFAGESESENAKRIRSDYKQTIAELHAEYILRIAEWSHTKGSLLRNQAHGSPTNLLDTYAAADIPEIEIFGAPDLDIPGLRREEGFIREDLTDPAMLRFSSSAAHVAGRNLVACETCTWLSDHFRVSLSQVKPQVDLLFLNGINHIVYHGVAYSPRDAIWPGWQFYASTSFAPTNTIWYDIQSLNAYVARCQSVLQAGKPDNDILVYFPVWDIWHHNSHKPLGLQVHNIENWLLETPFYENVTELVTNGFTFDYISDDQIARSAVEQGEWKTEGNRYKLLVVPDCRFIPETTMQNIAGQIEKGAQVLFVDTLEKKVPGYLQHAERQAKMDQLVKSLADNETDKMKLAVDLSKALDNRGIQREKITDHGIDFIRRKINDGRTYFIANQQSIPLHDWVELSFPAKSVLIMDPLTGKYGQAKLKTGKNSCSVYLDLEPGKSLVLKALNHKVATNPWTYLNPQADAYIIDGEWSVRFLKGGPTLPSLLKIRKLESWTSFNDTTNWFSGTAEYKIMFRKPEVNSNHWILDLGSVRESARVFVNGDSIATLWSIPFQIPLIEKLKPGENELVIQVTNLAANRIRYLDTMGVPWKKFHNINFVNIHYQPFDASVWDPAPSGLLGPVKLIPATIRSD